MAERQSPIPAAVHVRVSSDRQDFDLSVAVRLRTLQDYAERNGFIIVRQYIALQERG